MVGSRNKGWQALLTGSSTPLRRSNSAPHKCPLWVISRHNGRLRHVRFTPESGHSSERVGCPKSAISGHFSRVSVEDYKVTKIAGLRRAFRILLAGRIGDVDDHGLGNLGKLPALRF
jgi:hypothetical protein